MTNQVKYILHANSSALILLIGWTWRASSL